MVRAAFSGGSFGTVGSIYDLSGLAGQSIRFRWRIGSDDYTAWTGWYIDDVKVYRCISPDLTAPGAITNLSAVTGNLSGRVDLSWLAVGDDGNIRHRHELPGALQHQRHQQ